MKKITLLIIVILLFIPWAVQAQDAQGMAKVSVRLWPEYDQPSMLVIYDLTLKAGTSLPAKVTLRIPSTVADLHAVASRQPDGSLLNLPYDPPVQNGSWQEVTYTTTTLESRIEFYDNALVKDGTSRSYVYRWTGDYAVDSLDVEVQQPVGATQMVLSPSLGSGVVGNDGMTYFGADVGSLNQGQSFEIAIDYQKETDTLSTDSLNVEPVTPVSSSPSVKDALSSVLPWLLFGLGVVLIAGAGLWYWRSGRKGSRPEPRRKHKPASQSAKSPGMKVTSVQSHADKEGTIYCHECGKRASSGDRFCRTCGAQLRT
jgi:hypothetical protein